MPSPFKTQKHDDDIRFNLCSTFPNPQEILMIYILIVEFKRRHFVLSPVCYVPICISVHTISFYGCMTKWRVYGGSGKRCNGDQSLPILQRLLLSGTFNSLSAANTAYGQQTEMKYSLHRKNRLVREEKGKSSISFFGTGH